MPKKRKSQKIIAELRRKLATQQSEKPVSKPVFKKEKQIKKTPLISTKPEIPTQTVFSSFITSDLKKSLFLTGLAISLEFVLYYVLEVRGIKSFRSLTP